MTEMLKFHNANPIEMRFELVLRHAGVGPASPQLYHLHPGDECEIPAFMEPEIKRRGLKLTPGPSPRANATKVAPAPAPAPPKRPLPHGVERLTPSVATLIDEGMLDDDIATAEDEPVVEAAKPEERNAAVEEAMRSIEANGGKLRKPRRAQ